MNLFSNLLSRKKKYAEKAIVSHWFVIYKREGMLLPEVSTILCPNDDIARYFFNKSFIRLCKEVAPIMLEFDEREVMKRIEEREKAIDVVEKNGKDFINYIFKHLFGG